MTYIHADIAFNQSPRHPGQPCGDVVRQQRDEQGTTLIVSDGLGHGIKANIAANMCASRLLTLLDGGLSLEDAFTTVAGTMNRAWGSELPFAVFTVVRVLKNGQAAIMAYEMPPPLIVGSHKATVLEMQSSVVGKGVATSAQYFFDPGEAIIVMSDGVTQSGMGTRFRLGWEPQGAANFISTQLAAGIKHTDLPIALLRRAIENWGPRQGDDITAAAMALKQGNVLNILTGPPSSPNLDPDYIRDFFRSDGKKVVCGGTTAKILARQTGKRLEIRQEEGDPLTPPQYFIRGIDLTSEGAVTINQVYNLLDNDLLPKDSPVTDLCRLMREADKIEIFTGTGPNREADALMFKQLGILPRATIIPLLCQKLRQSGKLVIHHTY
jgi:hypothetical protein